MAAGKRIANIIRHTPFFSRMEYDEEYEVLAEIVDEFEEIEDDEHFDTVMERLYDWGDMAVGAGWPTPRMCWIETVLL